MNQVQELVDHFFRKESSKMIASLTAIFGLKSIDLAEEIVQESLVKALQNWSFKGIPEKPEAWLYQVAKNRAIDIIRKERKSIHFESDKAHLLQSEWTLSTTIKDEFTESQIEDDQLRMLFACCHPQLPQESQLAFALKTLCSFSVYEISRALLTSTANVNKRLYRAKEKFRTGDIFFEIPKDHQLKERLDSVHHIIYLIFNEGYYRSSGDRILKLDLCEEAIRLAFILFEWNKENKNLAALLALLSFLAARFDARDSDEFISLEDQDRSKWNQQLIQQGRYFLSLAESDELSSYHIEAVIAHEHVSATHFSEINWKRIVELYDLLYQIKKSNYVLLNRGISLSYAENCDAAIDYLKSLKGLEKKAVYHSALGHLYQRNKSKSLAKKAYDEALNYVESEHEKKHLETRLVAISES